MKKKSTIESKEPCPECGCAMIKTHPKRGRKCKSYPEGRIFYYKRLECTSCPHYQSNKTGTYRIKGEELSIEEKDDLRNKVAEAQYNYDKENKSD